jgi:hypothetical protein
MQKTLHSPILDFPGTVILPDMLILPQVLAWNDMLVAKDEVRDAVPKDRKLTLSENRKWIGKIDAVYLPVVFGIVLEWHIEHIPEAPTVETFPLTPRLASAQFLAWLVGEIQKVYDGEIQIPNA